MSYFPFEETFSIAGRHAVCRMVILITSATSCRKLVGSLGDFRYGVGTSGDALTGMALRGAAVGGRSLTPLPDGRGSGRAAFEQVAGQSDAYRCKVFESCRTVVLL